MPKLLLLPGDGIGPEIIAEVKRVAERITNELAIDERAFGGASLDAHGVPLTNEALETAKSSDAVLMGAVGGAVGASPWEKVPRNLRPEAGLLALRKGMEVFANLRPAICYGSLADAYPQARGGRGARPDDRPRADRRRLFRPAARRRGHRRRPEARRRH